jgi:crotonobetainyl-CoA:carnitine CoA-transferase CaiB-like acyl-CoA transferase
LNRGKRRIALDLQSSGDRRIAAELAAGADVVVENFRPGVMRRLGLGAEVMLAAHPRLVYCSLPGFAADDPRACVPAWEGIVMSATAGYRLLYEHWDWSARTNASVEDPGRPLFTGLPIASNTAALLGAVQVVAALLRRQTTGRGARIEVPLSEAMLEIVGFHLEFPDFVGPRLTLPKPFLGSFECQDGRYIDQVSYPRFVERLLRRAGVWEQWRAEGLTDMRRIFCEPALGEAATRRFADLIRTRPSGHWETLAIEIGTPLAAIRTLAEWSASAHARQSQSVVELIDPALGAVSMPGAAVELDSTPVTLRPRSLPDTDRADILAEISRRDTDTSATPESTDDRAPLDGISIVELSQVVAGPIAGRLLADLGADIVKIVNPAPDGNNGFHGSYTNRGKRTAYLNVRDPDDVQVLTSAIAEADVLLQNYAVGAIERYGLGYEVLRQIRADLIYVSLSAFSRRGPWRGRRGHENQAEAATGMSARYGGYDAWPIYQPYLVCDVGTGILGALATLLGLYHRAKSGEGQHVSSSLSHVATLHQGIYLTDGPGERFPEPTGTSALGWSELQRLYEASDGWLFVAAAPEQEARLLDTLGLSKPAATGPCALGAAAVIRQNTCAHWVRTFESTGIAALQVRELNAVANDPMWHRRGVLRHAENGEGRKSPVLGLGAPPWPLRNHLHRHPAELGAATASVREQFQTTIGTS